MTYQSCHSNIDWQQEPNGFNHFSVVEGQTRLQRLKLPLTETVCSSSQERQFFLPSSTRDILVASTCKYISMRKYHHVHYVKVNLILRAIFDELWKTIGWTWRSKPSAIDQLSIHGKHFRASSCKIASQQNATTTQGTKRNCNRGARAQTSTSALLPLTGYSRRNFNNWKLQVVSRAHRTALKPKLLHFKHQLAHRGASSTSMVSVICFYALLPRGGALKLSHNYKRRWYAGQRIKRFLCLTSWPGIQRAGTGKWYLIPMLTRGITGHVHTTVG